MIKTDNSKLYITKQEIKKLILVLMLINIPFLAVTYQNVWYSDDFQLIHAFTFKQELSNSLVSSLNDLFEVRSDGHLTPVHYLFNWFAGIVGSYKVWHIIVILMHMGAATMVYLFTRIWTSSKNVSLIASILYSLNYSFNIKVLTWNIWHSFSFNIITGLGLMIAVIMTLRGEFRGKFIIFALGILTVFNMETGFTFIVLSVILVIHESLKKPSVFNKNKILLIILILSPIALYGSIAKYQTGSMFPLLEQRTAAQSIRSNEDAEKSSYQKLMDARSRKAPRTIESYIIRTGDLLLASLNMSSLEYVIKYYLKDGLQYSLDEKNRSAAIFSEKNLPFFIYTMIFGGFIIALSLYLYRKELNSFFSIKQIQSSLVLYLAVILIFILLFHRKDIAQPVAVFSSVLLATTFEIVRSTKKQIYFYMLLSIMIIPSILYLITGYEYSYEMLSRSEREKVYIEFNNNLRNYSFNDGCLVAKLNDDPKYIENYSNDFYWFYIFEHRHELINDQYFKQFKNTTYDSMMDVVSDSQFICNN